MLRSTKQEDKDKAREFALSREKAARMALGPRLPMRQASSCLTRF